jgi:hypothetical protein
MARELERVSHDPLDASIRIDFLLNRDLLVRIGAHAPAGADIESFGVFTKDDEVDVVRVRFFSGQSRSSSRRTGR